MVLRRYFGKISPLQIGNLVGHEGEFVIDESTNYVYVMDGVTPGGQRILYTNVNAAVSNIYANVNPSINNYFTLGNVSNVWSNAFISNINSNNIALTNNLTIGNIQLFYQSGVNKLGMNGDVVVYGNLNISNSEIAANSTVSGTSKSATFINTSVPGNGNGFVFTNGTSGDTGVFHNLDNANVIQVSLTANGLPFISAGGNGNGNIGWSNTTINGNLSIASGFSPYVAQIGFAPTFVPSNAKLTYADQQNTYIQFLLQNKSNGNNASTDIVVTADNGSDTTHYVDLGINSSTFNGGGGLDGPDDGYLLVEGGKLLIATIDQPNDIIFAVGGDAPSNEMGRFKYGNGFSVNGNLTVTGNLNVTGNIVTTNYETISKTEYANSIVASGNVSATFFTGNAYYLSGLPATYGNTQVSAYLPTDSTISTLYSNAATQASNLASVASNLATLTSNAASQANDIATLYSNASAQASNLALLASNAATQESEIALLNANVTAANAAISGLQTGSGFATVGQLAANVNAANTSIASTNANVVAANTAIATLKTQVYSNSNVASYLPTYSGNSNAQFFTGNGYYLTGIISGSVYSNSNVSAYYVANTVATGNVQILASGNLRLPTGGTISESQGTGTITLSPNITASATAGVVIGGSGYLLAANGSRNAVLNYNSVNGQFGVAVLNIYNSSATAIVNGGTSNIGNIGGPSSYFGNAFVSNVYSQNYYYPNGISILTGIGGTYSNTNVGQYLPTYSGNSNAAFFTGNGYYLTGITSGSTYSNTNVGYYLNSNVITSNITIQGNINTTGNIYGNVVTVGTYYVSNITTTGGTSGNISGSGYVVANNLVANTNVYANGFYWLNNGAAFSSGAGSTYSNTNVAAYLPTYAGNVNANFYLGNGYYLTGITGGGSTYSNTNVAAYLVTYNGNISAGNLSLSSGASGNISGTGYVVAGNMVANTGVYGNSFYWYNNNATLASTITGTFANANVAGYLPTYTGNVGAGNIILTNLGNIIAATNSNLSIRTYGLYNILIISGVAGGYNSPPYTSQSLTGGSGSGMTASYSSVGGYVTQSSLVVTNPGTGYKNGDTLTLPGGLGSTVILSNYNQNITTSKAYNWTFSTYDGNITVPGNIIMPSNSYVLGDFTNSNVAYRTFFQTTTANATTGIYAAPTGTATGASWQAINTNTTNANNASKILIATNGNTDVQLISGINGSGTYLPLSFYNNGAAQMVIYPNGSINTSNANPITTTGNVNAGYFVGNGSALTGIQANLQASNIYGTSSNVTIVAGTYSSVFSNVGMVTMPNVTVTGNTSVTGNITAGNVIATGTSGTQTRFLWDTWQANTNASLTSFTPSGSISGNASWDANQAYGLKLTTATNTQNGNIYWNSSTVNYNYDMVITASVGAGGGNGADGQYIFLGCSAVPTSQSNNVGGIHVYNHYYSNQWEIYVAGTQYIIPFIGEDATNYLPSGIRVWNGTYVCFYNITAKIRRIQNGARMLEIYLNEAYQGSVNISSWSPAGNYFGVTGITGGSNSQHWVRQLRIDW